MVQISNQPFTWQQCIRAWGHGQDIFLSLNQASKWRRKVRYGNFDVEWLLVPDGLGWLLQKQLLYWDFHVQQSLEFTASVPKKRNHPSNFSSFHHITPWSRWATAAAEDHTRCHSCYLRTENLNNWHGIAKIGQQKICKRCLAWWISIPAVRFW